MAGWEMAKKSRNERSPAFKASVALKAIKGDAAVAGLGSRDGVRPNQVCGWRNASPDGALRRLLSMAARAPMSGLGVGRRSGSGD
jgi:transposase-like protein